MMTALRNVIVHILLSDQSNHNLCVLISTVALNYAIKILLQQILEQLSFN